MYLLRERRIRKAKASFGNNDGRAVRGNRRDELDGIQRFVRRFRTAPCEITGLKSREVWYPTREPMQLRLDRLVISACAWMIIAGSGLYLFRSERLIARDQPALRAFDLRARET